MSSFVEIFSYFTTLCILAISLIVIYRDVRSIKKQLVMKQMIKTCHNRHRVGLTNHLVDTQGFYFNKQDYELLSDMWNVPGYTFIIDTSITKRLTLSWKKASH